MSYSWPDFVGNVGVFLVLLSYFLLQLDRIDPKSFGYSALNAAGAILICVSLYFAFNLSSFIIEIFWLGISVFGMIRALQAKPPAA
jgi:hypothetical protein